MASSDVECAECQAIIVELISASEELLASGKGDEVRADVIALRELVQGESGEEARSEELFRKYKFDARPELPTPKYEQFHLLFCRMFDHRTRTGHGDPFRYWPGI
jgi:hypothetical protein